MGLGRGKGTGGGRKELDHGDACRWAQTDPTATPVASQSGSWMTKGTAGPGASCSKQISKSTLFHLHGLLMDDRGHFLCVRTPRSHSVTVPALRVCGHETEGHS